MMNRPIRAYVAQATDRKTIRMSSSGGLFYLLAARFIDNGGVVFGAAFDGNVVRHRYVENKTDLKLLLKSKYVQSDVSDAMILLGAALAKGRRVMFAGTPCQVRSVRCKYPDEKYPNLITIDILCHGTPPYDVYKSYLDELESREGSRVVDYDWRWKDDGWSPLKTKVVFESGKVIISSMDDYFFAFQHLISLRQCCGSCPFMRPERVGDLTLGDAWGLSRYWFVARENLGVSVLLVNTRAGMSLFKSLDPGDIRIRAVPLSKIVEKQAVLQRSSPLHPAHDEFCRLLKSGHPFSVALRIALKSFWEKSTERRLRILDELSRVEVLCRIPLMSIFFKHRRKVLRMSRDMYQETAERLGIAL